MTFFDLYMSAPVIYLSWWLPALVLFLVAQEKGTSRLQQSHQFSLGLIAAVMSIGKLISIYSASSYWREQLTYYEMEFGLPIFVFFVLESLVVFIPIMNLWRNNRASFRIQAILLSLIGCYLLVNFWLYGIPFSDWATAVIPGWHTTIFGTFGIEFVPVFFLAFLFAALFLQVFRWLPEHRKENLQ